MPVVHGRVPSLAYRVSYEDEPVTFAGDDASETGSVAELARGTDVLVHHRLLEAGTDPDDPKTELHSTAAGCGATASEADVGGSSSPTWVGTTPATSTRSLLARVHEAYDGPVVVVRDLVDIRSGGTVEGARRGPESGARYLPSGDG